MNIALDQSEYELLKGALVENRDTIAGAQFDEKRQKYFLCLQEKKRKELLDELSNVFMDKGIGENGEPNQVGLVLDDLIDKFGGAEP